MALCLLQAQLLSAELNKLIILNNQTAMKTTSIKSKIQSDFCRNIGNYTEIKPVCGLMYCTSALMDAFEPVSVPRYNVSLLGLRSLQNQRYMYAVTAVRRSTMQAIASMEKDGTFTMSHVLYGAGFLPGFQKW